MNPMTAETIAQALAGDRRPRKTSTGWLTWCPCHDDRNPSLSVAEKGGRLLAHCFSGCARDVLIEALRNKGLWPERNGNRPQTPKARIVATYDYKDASGRLIFQVCRLEPKSFRQRRPDPDKPGGWLWNIKGASPVPYRLPELLAADPAAPVFVCEGEKDVDQLVGLGLTGTCNPGGAGKWRAEYNKHFRGRLVVVLPDNDEPGRKHAQDVARHLHGVAASVKIVELPGLNEKGDVSDWLKAGGTAQALLDLAEAAPEFEPQVDPLAGTPYSIENGCLAFTRQTREGPITSPLCNFIAHAQEEIVRDDGRERTREFVIAGTLNNGQPLPPVSVKAQEFRSMTWVSRAWGLQANLTAGQNAQDRVREAIQHLSMGAKERTVFTHTGWRKLNGSWAYLHGGGAIGGPQDVEVDLGSDLTRYSLPAPGGPAEVRRAAEAGLRFLDVGPWPVTAPILAAVYLAPLADLLQVDFTLWLLGQSGVFKSTLAALALCHFGNFHRTTLPGQWSSTGNALERRAFVLKDALFVIDDYAPPHNARAAHDLEAKAHRVCRAAGNRAGRQRLDSSAGERQTYSPRGLIVATGEALPTGQSLLARLFVVEVAKGEIGPAKLAAAQGDRNLYAQALAGFLTYLAPRLDQILETSRRQWEAYRAEAQAEGHSRVPEMIAWLMVGFRLFTAFCQNLEIISAGEAREMDSAAWSVFMKLGQAHAKRIEGERPSLRFINVLRELLVQRRIYFQGTNGACPKNWADLGWQSPEDPGPQAEHIGWAPDGNGVLYLMPDAAFRVVQETIRRQGEYLGLGRNGLFEALYKDGYLESDGNGEHTLVKRLAGRPRRVICLKNI